ncbi:WYL domain-containing protein [Vogesella indigofera]|uniref:WYL domain-containing protein n=1 Tax=Vogesella indigofera TaxID=45465 RepID=UPI00234F3D7B|nr:WYL domain-containing protein [Vogesella indigofera]MDC7698336.1 WYL domain-containing protein [Vogesella indigofera]
MSQLPDALCLLTHNQRQRLSYLEFCLYFLGEVRRADMMARFDCAPAVVTRDIALYRQLAAANLVLDPSTKAYRITTAFSPLFEHRLEQVMSALMQGEPYSIEPIGNPLLPGDYPALLNRPAMPTLAAVSRTIRQQRCLRVRYHSASSGEQERIIAPHALVDSGLRWHVRAYDRLRGRFIDLVLTRLLTVEMLDEAPLPHERPVADEQWQREITLELVPHPRHTDAVITALDYAMSDGVLAITVRAANVSYLLRRWYIDCSPDAAIADQACRLWLRNTTVLRDSESRTLAPGYKE